MSPHALEASGLDRDATHEEVGFSDCRVYDDFPCLCRKILICSGLTIPRRITYKKVSIIDQKKFEGVSETSQEKLPGKETPQAEAERWQSPCPTSQSSSPPKSAWVPQSLSPSLAHPKPPSGRQAPRTYFPVPAYPFLGSSFSANP